jgi:hypothetical protein
MTAMTPTQQPTDTTDPLNDPSGTTVASEAMQSVFCMTPHAWQEQALLISRPLPRALIGLGVQPAATLLLLGRLVLMLPWQLYCCWVGSF